MNKAITYSISWEEVRRLLDYDPHTGHLTWLVDRGRSAKAGQRAGSLHHSGYRNITLVGETYSEHVVIWFWMTKEWPLEEVDHADTDPLNNRWENLRSANRSEQCQNSRSRRSVSKGVSFCSWKVERPYRARIYFRKRHLHLGYFDTEQEAHAAYVQAARRCFGKFARAA